MGVCQCRRRGSLLSWNLARLRFFSVWRRHWDGPLRGRSPIGRHPSNGQVAGVPTPRRCLLAMAQRPTSIRRVCVGWRGKAQRASLACKACRNRVSPSHAATRPPPQQPSSPCSRGRGRDAGAPSGHRRPGRSGRTACTAAARSPPLAPPRADSVPPCRLSAVGF